MEDLLNTVESLHVSQETLNINSINFLQNLRDIKKHTNSKGLILNSVKNEILQSIVHINSTNSVLVVAVLDWLNQQLLQNQLMLNKTQINQLINWLNSVKETGIVNAFCTIRLLSAAFQDIGFEILDMFNPSRFKVLQSLGTDNTNNSPWNNISLILEVLQCMEHIISVLGEIEELSDNQKETIEEVANTILRLHYKGQLQYQDSGQFFQILMTSLITLQRICVMHPEYTGIQISELFGICKLYMHYEIYNKQDTMQIKPQKVYSSQMPIYVNEVAKLPDSSCGRNNGGKVSKMRKLRGVTKGSRQNENTSVSRTIEKDLLQNNFEINTIESDFSEPEICVTRNGLERRQIKIRLLCIELMGIVARSQAIHVIYGYWHVFFSNNINNMDSLFSVGLKDPAIRCRYAALQVSSQLLFGSKKFLYQAESNARSSSLSYTSFSENLSLLIISTYEVLALILSNESSLSVLMQALKCLALLVQATPFKKLKSGYIKRFMPHVQSLLYHRDATIQVSALLVFELMIGTSELTSEIINALGFTVTKMKPTTVNHMTETIIEMVEMDYFDEKYVDSKPETIAESPVKVHKTKEEEEPTSWLLQYVIESLLSCHASKDDVKHKPVNAAVHIASLQVLTAMSTHFTMLSDNLSLLALALKKSLDGCFPSDVRLYAARCLDACAYQMSCHLLSNLKDYERCAQFWSVMLPIVMQYVRSTKEQVVTFKICLCDALSNIGSIMFERFPYSTQLQLLSFLSGIGSDITEDITVRIASIRALAVFVLFPSLQSNLVFIENTAELILRSVKDSNLLVRIKALWSLGNISDALFLTIKTHANIKASGLFVTKSDERISDDLLRRLIDSATEACNDNDKVRCNAVRTLGNLMSLLEDRHFQEITCRMLVQKALSKLSDCVRGSGNAKVKWNSCYAIGNLISCSALFEATNKYSAELNWQTSLYGALCHAIMHHSNFKVRINGTLAIINIEKRSYFGQHFEMFWCSLLIATEQSERLDNFFEYNHRDQLQQQLCLAMCHMIDCALYDDFPLLKKHLVERLELVRTIWTRVVNRMLPEKVAPMLACSTLLKQRFDNASQLSMEQKKSITFIMRTFAYE